MLKAKINIQILKVDRRLITLFKPFFRGKEIWSSEMSIFFKNFGPYSKLQTANWPIAWRKQTQPYNNLKIFLKFCKFSLDILSLQCRRILGGRKLLVYVRTVVTAIFDVMTEEDSSKTFAHPKKTPALRATIFL